ncbi:MAG: hypothetical protein K2M75_00630 [Clostridia bacterium]|nr:hypothetical protein [Clostridia bacterium]
MTKELQELEKRIKKERSKIMKERMQEMFEHCNEVYYSISIVELRLIWYLRQFTQWTPEYCMESAKYVYRAKRNAERTIEEEKNISIDKP